MIKITGLTKTYGSRKVLDREDFTFLPGKRYGIIGANGSGKTTLLRILAGALKPDGGSVQLPPERNKNRGYMPQHPYSFGFSVLKNVQIAFEKEKTAKAEALAALEKVGLAELALAKGSNLSGGESQRMAIARMIARPRPLLLLDEPTSATDIAGNRLIEAALVSYCQATGCTLLFTTHSPAQVQALADTVIMMDKGKIIEWGPVEKVLFQPEHPATKEFLEHWRLQPVEA